MNTISKILINRYVDDNNDESHNIDDNDENETLNTIKKKTFG